MMEMAAQVKETGIALQAVSFSLRNEITDKKEEYAIPINQVREIRTVDNITEIPNSASYVRGMINLRGTIIPVIDLKQILGFRKDSNDCSSSTRTLVIESGNDLYGILVDEVDKVIKYSEDDMQDMSSDLVDTKKYVQKIIKIDERIVVLFDMVSLINDCGEDLKDKIHQEQEVKE